MKKEIFDIYKFLLILSIVIQLYLLIYLFIDIL